MLFFTPSSRIKHSKKNFYASALPRNLKGFYTLLFGKKQDTIEVWFSSMFLIWELMFQMISVVMNPSILDGLSRIIDTYFGKNSILSVIFKGISIPCLFLSSLVVALAISLVMTPIAVLWSALVNIGGLFIGVVGFSLALIFDAFDLMWIGSNLLFFACEQVSNFVCLRIKQWMNDPIDSSQEEELVVMHQINDFVGTESTADITAALGSSSNKDSSSVFARISKRVASQLNLFGASSEHQTGTPQDIKLGLDSEVITTLRQCGG